MTRRFLWTTDGIYLPAIFDVVVCDTVYDRGRPEKVEPFIESANYEGVNGGENRPLTGEEIDNIPIEWIAWVEEQEKV